ncbi:MAG: peptidoglycan-associated lipoprotein Pal [Nitrospinae bacterium]|nr:peptidoglycan-associated lipoprotein Pal [Nitrospinota bacterium]
MKRAEEEARLKAEKEARLKTEEERKRIEEEKLKEAEGEIKPQIAREAETKAAPQLEDIHFDFDKSDIKTDAREALQKNADWLQKNPDIKIQIEGHCDERGTAEYNLALGERRAMSTKKYLISLGISADRIYTISYGEELPIDPNHSEDAWAKNRRAHFLVITKT